MVLNRVFNLYISSKKDYVKKLHNILGFTPRNLKLYEMAFRHKSVSVVIKEDVKNSNERLEFLGDAILGSVIAELLFKLYPYKGEGFLTEMRSKIVSRSNLNQLSQKIGLNDLIEFDRKAIPFGSKHGSMLGDAFEALIGAIYLDRGYVFTRKFLLTRIITPHIDIHTLEHTETNFKSRLIEWCQHKDKEVLFELLVNTDQDDKKLFNVRVLVDGNECGQGKDFSKKSAEKLAAEKACEFLQIFQSK